MFKYLVVFCCSTFVALMMLGVSPVAATSSTGGGGLPTGHPNCCKICGFATSRAMCQGFCQDYCYGVDYTSCMYWCSQTFDK